MATLLLSAMFDVLAFLAAGEGAALTRSRLLLDLLGRLPVEMDDLNSDPSPHSDGCGRYYFHCILSKVQANVEFMLFVCSFNMRLFVFDNKEVI